MAPRTTVLIVSWNTRELLLACLEALALHAPGTPVWVIDNASADGSAGSVRDRFPDVRVVESPENLGFAAANNQLLREVASPFAWLLNPDTEIRAGALKGLEATLDADPRVAVAGSALTNPDGSPQACSFSFPTPVATWAEWLFLPQPLAELRDRRLALTPRRAGGPTDWVLGASMLVRMAAVAEVGLMDEGYFMYSEELDWCRRFRAAGWGVSLTIDSVVMHVGGASTRQVSERMLTMLFATRGRYFRKHLAWASRWPWCPLLFVGACWNSAYVLLRRLPGQRAGTQWAIARAAWKSSR